MKRHETLPAPRKLPSYLDTLSFYHILFKLPYLGQFVLLSSAAWMICDLSVSHGLPAPMSELE